MRGLFVLVALAAHGKGMVSADNDLAAEAGAQALRDGGDAVDAAVVTALVLGVTQPFGSGIGGGGFALVHRVDGKAYALDFREVAPKKAHKDMYLDPDGAVIPHASTRGPKAAGVPGEVAGLFELHRRHGKLPWKRVVEPALKLARDGFPAGELLHERVKGKLELIRREPELADQFLRGKKRKKMRPVKPGERVVRPSLAKTLRVIADGGADAFYRGDLARRLAKAFHEAGGLITAEDLAAYRVKERAPLEIPWRGMRVLSMPPPSSGGAVIGQVLRVLEPLDLKKLGHNSPAYLQHLVEALKHAFADRARVMGDPDFTAVPVEEMLADGAVQRVRAAFRADATLKREAYGAPHGLPNDGGTSHLSVVDGKGNAVALTTTVNTSFGSLFLAHGTGILLNNQMDDFVAKPGVPNAFGLIGREANGIQPGKRPLSSMSPTVVLDGKGRALLVVGGSGGPTIITGTLQVLLNVLAFGMRADEAVRAPRIHHQWVPEVLMADEGLPAQTVKAMAARGHETKTWKRWTAVQVVAVGADGPSGAADPSKKGKAVSE